MSGVGTLTAVFADDVDVAVAMPLLAEAFCIAAAESDAEGCDLLQPTMLRSAARAREGMAQRGFMLRSLYWQSRLSESGIHSFENDSCG
jgi:hypothetical protein